MVLHHVYKITWSWGTRKCWGKQLNKLVWNQYWCTRSLEFIVFRCNNYMEQPTRVPLHSIGKLRVGGGGVQSGKPGCKRPDNRYHNPLDVRDPRNPCKSHGRVGPAYGTPNLMAGGKVLSYVQSCSCKPRKKNGMKLSRAIHFTLVGIWLLRLRMGRSDKYFIIGQRANRYIGTSIYRWCIVACEGRRPREAPGQHILEPGPNDPPSGEWGVAGGKKCLFRFHLQSKSN